MDINKSEINNGNDKICMICLEDDSTYPGVTRDIEQKAIEVLFRKGRIDCLQSFYFY